MENRPIYTGTLEDLLKIIPQLTYSLEGHYLLFAPIAIATSINGKLHADTLCGIGFLLSDDEDNYVPEGLEGMLSIASLSDIKQVINVAFKEKPNANELDLAKAINYYLLYDAFLSFDE